MSRVKIDNETEGRAETVLPSENEVVGNYFVNPSSTVELLSTGCKLFDLVLGGGYPIGRIVNIIGDSSTGKCVRNAYVLSDKLEKLDNNSFNYGITEFNKPKNLVVDKLGKADATHFYREKVSKTIKITTKHGYELEGTLDHKICVWTKDCSYEMKKLSDIKLNDVVVIAKGTNIFRGSPPKINQFYEYNQNIHATNIKHINIPDEMTDWLGQLLGMFVADGNIVENSNTVFISNSQQWVKTLTDEIKDNLGLSKNTTPSFSSKELVTLIRNILGSPDVFTARNKYVPEVILNSPKNIQAAFLQCLIDCDSSLYDTHIEYCTASEKLAEQVKLMLLNFGVVCTHEKINGAMVGDKFYDNVYHNLHIYGKNTETYIKEIGTIKYLSKVKDLQNVKQCSDYNNIPFIYNKFRAQRDEIKNLLNVQKNGIIPGRGRFPKLRKCGKKSYGVHGCTYEYIQKIIDNFSNIKEFDISTYKQIMDTDYHYDYITNIEVLNNEVDVYDVHIPNTHLFWCNGFISHNTLLSIEAMAQFAKKYENGKIWYNEAEAAFDIGYAASLGMPVNRVEFVENNFTVEDFYHDLDKRLEELDKNETGLYILDSLDALSDKAELDRDISDSSFGAAKAKKLSELFRRLVQKLENKRMLVIIVSQVRENIGVTFGAKYTRSGGKALDFYASQKVMLAHAGNLKKTKKGVEKIYGITIKAKCTKNKIGDPHEGCTYNIIFGYGIDSVKANIDFLEEIKALDKEGVKEWQKRIDKADDNEFISIEKELDELVVQKWNEIKQEFKPRRKKYGG
jgi:RecA/RadA recombinase